ncbi:MAG: DNA adenine methylase [Parvibaculales bacterium]
MFYSPLRYPGGKTKLASFVKELFYENKMIGLEYVEPFAGGAGVALSLLFEEYVSTITINDFDRSVYAFWYSVITDNERFCERLERVNIDIPTWFQQKEIQQDKENSDLFSLGFSTFFLNRTNFSGVINGGVIGGKEQNGKYKINARFNKNELIKKIQKIYQYRSRIKVTNRDAVELIQELDPCFVYLDPPYVSKSKDLYMNQLMHSDHKKLSRFLLSAQSQFHWLLSYDCNRLIKDLYHASKNPMHFNLHYGTSKMRTDEYIFTSKRLKTKTSRKIFNNNSTTFHIKAAK